MIIEEESNYLRYDLIEKNSKKFFYPSSKKLYRDYQFNIISHYFKKFIPKFCYRIFIIWDF